MLLPGLLLGALGHPVARTGALGGPNGRAFAVKAARRGARKKTKLGLIRTRRYEGRPRALRQTTLLEPGAESGAIHQVRSGGFAARVRLCWARLNKPGRKSLSRGTMPGALPDFLSRRPKLWDLSLVDPDNRRPVEFPAAKGRAFAGHWTARPGADLDGIWPKGVARRQDQGLAA